LASADGLLSWLTDMFMRAPLGVTTTSSSVGMSGSATTVSFKWSAAARGSGST
jgi:hypothetical protein